MQRGVGYTTPSARILFSRSSPSPSFFAYVLRARPRLPEDLRFANQNGFAALNRTVWRGITMQAECQSRGFSIKVLFIPQLREIYISRILLFLCPTKDFFRNLYLRFSTKIFYLYELVIKWRAGQKEKRSTPQTKKGGFGISLPAEYDAAFANLVSSLAPIISGRRISEPMLVNSLV